jgi:hypothetical protein
MERSLSRADCPPDAEDGDADAVLDAGAALEAGAADADAEALGEVVVELVPAQPVIRATSISTARTNAMSFFWFFIQHYLLLRFVPIFGRVALPHILTRVFCCSSF